MNSDTQNLIKQWQARYKELYGNYIELIVCVRIHATVKRHPSAPDDAKIHELHQNNAVKEVDK